MVSYDVGKKNRRMHIREDGTELKLPHEVVPIKMPSSPKARKH